ncbi:MAG TPA: DUF309 domain-containing protein [Acidothermaceae bacterium]|jgi:hypothetical protein|nr:DUF309 domain-containing protein [Acidothermaceae bacterium]
MADRDRDPAGRARNARPRDGLGRPLPRGAAGGTERVPDKLDMGVDDAIALAQRYLDDGRPFHAHEVLEALWKTQPPEERDLWQGLAQIAVGSTHALRGSPVGATTLLRRGAARVASYHGETYGIDVDRVVSWAETLADAPTTEFPNLRLSDADGVREP